MDEKKGSGKQSHEEDLAKLMQLEVTLAKELEDVRKRLWFTRVNLDKTLSAFQQSVMHEVCADVPIVELRRLIGEYAAPILLLQDKLFEDVSQIYGDRRPGFLRFTALTWREMPREFTVRLNADDGVIQFELWTTDFDGVEEPQELFTQTVISQPTGMESIEVKVPCRFDKDSGQLLLYPDSTQAIIFDPKTGQLLPNRDGVRKEIFIGPSRMNQRLVIVNRVQPQAVYVHIE